MRSFFKFAAASAVVAASLAVAAPASAAVVIKPVESGVFTLGNPIGTIAGIKVSTGNTYDFTFTLGGTYDVIMQMQATMFKLGAQIIDFTLYSGVPSSGVALGSSPLQTGTALERVLGPGSYYLQVNTIALDKELVSGSISLCSADCQ